MLDIAQTITDKYHFRVRKGQHAMGQSLGKGLGQLRVMGCPLIQYQARYTGELTIFG
jgi:hypothetical protein